MSKTEAKEMIGSFFSKTGFSSDEMRKIKRIAMKYRIRLGSYKRRFCKKCLCQLKGKTRVSAHHKSVECSNCSFRNNWKIN